MKHKIYLSKKDMMYHVLFWDNYGGNYGWHRNDDMTSASGFLLRKEAEAWAEQRTLLETI